MIKRCNKCKKEKNIFEFHKWWNKIRKKYCYYFICKECKKIQMKKYAKNYYQKNREIIKDKKKEYYKKNEKRVFQTNKKYNKETHEEKKERLREKNKKYYKENKEKCRERNRICYLKHRKKRALYAKNNRGRYRKWVNNHYENNINHRLRILISGRMREKLKKDKSDNTINLLGCSIKYFKNHIEGLFEDGMGWDNYGLKKWHSDHIIPCSKFELQNSEEQEICFHFTNYQPLWAKDNLIKSNKFEVNSDAI